MTGFTTMIALALAAAPATVPTSSGAKAAETTEEVRRRELNEEQAERARQQVGENYAREDNYAEAVKKREAEIKRMREAYAATLAQHSAQEAAFQQAMAAWRVQACAAGMKEHCPAR